MMRRFAHSWVLFLLAALPLRAAPENAAGGRPDVLFIAIDDMNDWISLLDPGSPIKTPNLERLAGRGTLFTRAYCISAACNPSRVALLSGLRPSSTGVYSNNVDWRRKLPGRRTLMQQFMANGYEVRGAGKIFHHKGKRFHDEASFHDFQPMGPQNMPPRKLNQGPEYGSRNTDWGVWPANEKDTIDFRTADYCIEALSNPPADKPLFLACGIFKPHSPFFAPPEYHRGTEEIAPPSRKEDDWKDLPSGAHALMKRTKWFWTGMMKLDRRLPGSLDGFVQAYAACCGFADAQVGRVLAALEASPRRERTIVVLWSDHGFHLGEKEHIEKFALWEKSNHVPFIVVVPEGVRATLGGRWKGSPGTRCERPVDLSVVYPTLLELCGLPAARCDGVSVVPLLRDPGLAWERPALMTYLEGNHAVRSERWRYIRYADGSEELYDHESDPQEWHNLAQKPALGPVKERHRRWLPANQ